MVLQYAAVFVLSDNRFFIQNSCVVIVLHLGIQIVILNNKLTFTFGILQIVWIAVLLK